MTDREKLIALMRQVEQARILRTPLTDCVDHLIANGVTVQRWIPVTERLPEVGKHVLAYGKHPLGRRIIDIILFFDAELSFWRTVTHWMPLPEPPKEGE